MMPLFTQHHFSINLNIVDVKIVEPNKVIAKT